MTRVALSFVVEGRKGQPGRLDLERLLRAVGFDIVGVTRERAMLAIEAFRRFGKGRHRAGLKIGDCFAYALAAATGEPLLSKGNDFSHTDLQPVLPGGPP